MLAGTTTGIEPVYAVAYKRRYLKNGTTNWKYQFAVDHVCQTMIEKYSLDPEKIDTALSMSTDVEKRIKFQADVQDYVDMSISSTINLPKWDEDKPTIEPFKFATILAKYASRLRGMTVYPDGARGGQPLTMVPYKDAVGKLGQEFEESGLEFNDACDIRGGGFCGT